MLTLLLEVFEYQYDYGGVTVAGCHVPSKALSDSPL